MKLVGYALLLTATLISASASAGRPFEGWGKDPNTAAKEALEMARTQSPAKCLCKDWSLQLERDCRPAMGGIICSACGSNHKGSCQGKSDFEKMKAALGI